MTQNQTKSNDKTPPIKAIIGLGNPGRKYLFTRHNIGFRILDSLAEHYNAQFKMTDDLFELAQIPDKSILLIKPQTFMNASGKVIPFLKKKNIKADEIMVVHDDLELPFGTIKVQQGGSHKGHNGLKSIIEYLGANDFWRLRFGIGRPEIREQVPDYVLEPFDQPIAEVDRVIQEAAQNILTVLS